MRRLYLRIDGMDCAEAFGTLHAALTPLPGIQRADFNRLERRACVSCAPTQARTDTNIQAAFGHASLWAARAAHMSASLRAVASARHPLRDARFSRSQRHA